MSYSQLKQDLWVLDKLNQKKDGVFIEVGANDGINLSNTYLLEKDYGWSGVCVECDPNSVRKLRLNRGCQIIDRACHKQSGLKLSFNCDSDSTMSKVSLQGNTVVESISLNDICSKLPSTEIDYISLDVEGCELSILSSFNFNKYNVKCWTIEHNLEINDNESIENYLSLCYGLLNNNYLVKRHDWDLFAVKDNHEPEFYKGGIRVK